SSPLRTAKSGPDGSYEIKPLPPGQFVVGVNASTYKDEDVYPPALYLDGRALYLAETGTLTGIDLVLPPSRTAAQLRVRLLGPDGRPFPGAIVTLENLAGVQRWFSRNESDQNGQIAVPVYVGERYVVKAFHYVDGAEFVGSAQIEIADERPATSF